MPHLISPPLFPNLTAGDFFSTRLSNSASTYMDPLGVVGVDVRLEQVQSKAVTLIASKKNNK